MSETPREPRPAPAHLPERRSDGPRRVSGGLKLRRGEGEFPRAEVARRWMNLVESAMPIAVLAEGMAYAAAGQVLRMSTGGGVVRATVQGRAARPYQTTLSVQPLDEAGWSSLIEAMSGEAASLAALLEGRLPQSLAALGAAMGLEIVPSDAAALTARCTCAEIAPCKHAAAVAHLIGERLDEDALLVLALRGRAHDELLADIQQARALRQRGAPAVHADPLIPETTVEAAPLEACLGDYWRPGPELSDLADRAAPHYAPHSLLRRLGPSPLEGRFPLSGLLASIYDTVAGAVRRLRERAEVPISNRPLPNGDVPTNKQA